MVYVYLVRAVRKVIIIIINSLLLIIGASCMTTRCKTGTNSGVHVSSESSAKGNVNHCPVDVLTT